MPFRFSLATVLRVREGIEKREERALQRIQLEIARVARQIVELNAVVAKAHAAQNQALRQPTPGGELHSTVSQIQAVTQAKNELTVKLHNLDEQRLKQMNIYQAAHRDHETMISLFKEQRAAHELDEARREQKYLDDIFMARRHGK